jgi:hypothetical protein
MKYIKFLLPVLLLSLFLAGCGTKAANKSAEGKDTTAASELISKEGVFNGTADSHTIEVSVDKGDLELQVKNELQSTVNSLAEGDKIKFTYSVNKNKQNELSSIEKVK